jgi:hypothetical protein
MTPETEKRLHQIERRNQIRRDADLPMLSPAVELRRMKRQESVAELDRYQAVHGAAVMAQVLQQWRERYGADWKPNWMAGMAIQNAVRAILRQQMKRQARS